MRVLMASSFHVSSTRDVWIKMVKGLRANGVEVVPFDLAGRFSLFTFLHDKASRSKRSLPRDWTPTVLAYEALLGAALFHDCDWVAVTSPQFMPSEIPLLIRKAGLKTAAMLTECPYEDTIHTPVVASAFDAVFVNDLYSRDLFGAFCPFVEYVPHSFDPDTHYPGTGQRDDNIVFVGTGYRSRIDFMKKVEWPVRLDMYGWWPKEWLRYDAELRKNVRKSRTSWNAGVQDSNVGRHLSTVTEASETADIYRAAGASFSMHREARYVGTDEQIIDGEAYSLGPRNWELAACRTFQISDARPELADVFGDSVPLYETPQEFTALMKKAFADPSWRDDLAYQQWEKAQPYSCVNTMKTVAQVLAVA
jgi:Glycosyl transferases group 1